MERADQEKEGGAREVKVGDETVDIFETMPGENRQVRFSLDRVGPLEVGETLQDPQAGGPDGDDPASFPAASCQFIAGGSA